MKLREVIYNDLADLTQKGERRVDLNSTFRQKAREISMTEEAVKEEIKETKERLEILKVVMARDKVKGEQDQGKMQEEADKLEAKAQELQDKANQLEEKLKAI